MSESESVNKKSADSCFSLLLLLLKGKWSRSWSFGCQLTSIKWSLGAKMTDTGLKLGMGGRLMDNGVIQE